MLKYSMKKKVENIPFQIELDDEVVDLEFTMNTVADALRMNRIQQKYFDLKKYTEDEQQECFSLARVVTSVKTPDGEYYWGDDIEELRGVFSGDMFYHMLIKVGEMNPTVIDGETLDAKKK